jgi:hypothetical protein
MNESFKDAPFPSGFSRECRGVPRDEPDEGDTWP